MTYSPLVDGGGVVPVEASVVDASVELTVVVGAVVLVETEADVELCAAVDVSVVAAEDSSAVIKIGDSLRKLQTAWKNTRNASHKNQLSSHNMEFSNVTWHVETTLMSKSHLHITLLGACF